MVKVKIDFGGYRIMSTITKTINIHGSIAQQQGLFETKRCLVPRLFSITVSIRGVSLSVSVCVNLYTIHHLKLLHSGQRIMISVLFNMECETYGTLARMQIPLTQVMQTRRMTHTGCAWLDWPNYIHVNPSSHELQSRMTLSPNSLPHHLPYLDRSLERLSTVQPTSCKKTSLPGCNRILRIGGIWSDRYYRGHQHVHEPFTD